MARLPNDVLKRHWRAGVATTDERPIEAVEEVTFTNSDHLVLRRACL
jgi:hypothetical protein